MKRSFHRKKSKGFTLLELMVAMSITALIVTVLVTITSISLDAWRRSRAEVRAARQAKAALETLAKDFESLLVRSGNPYEWLVAQVEPALSSGGGLAGPSNAKMPNAAQIVFFNSATDRYDGEIGTAKDLGGDVSAVGYRMVYRDPISDIDGGGGSGNVFPVFALYRNLVDPKPAFDSLLAQTDLLDKYGDGSFPPDDEKDTAPSKFIVENIYGLTLTFVIEFEDPADPGVIQTERVSIMPGGSSGSGSTQKFVIAGDGIRIGGSNSGGGSGSGGVESGRVVAVDLSITVLSDFGLQQAANTSLDAERIILEHGYHYSKSVLVPQP